jgi:hypothetical protein
MQISSTQSYNTLLVSLHFQRFIAADDKYYVAKLCAPEQADGSHPILRK